MTIGMRVERSRTERVTARLSGCAANTGGSAVERRLRGMSIMRAQRSLETSIGPLHGSRDETDFCDPVALGLGACATAPRLARQTFEPSPIDGVMSCLKQPPGCPPDGMGLREAGCAEGRGFRDRG